MFIAAQRGHLAMIGALAELGADLKAAKNDGATPAFVAAQEGHTEVLRALVKHGADLNTVVSNGTTIAVIAARGGHVEVLRALIDWGVDMDFVANNGYSPLTAAVLEGQREASTFLVNIGADLTQCLENSAAPDVEHIREIMTQFYSEVGLPNNSSMLSLTKLMCCVFLDQGADRNNDGSLDALFEIHIAISMRQLLSNTVIERMQQTRSVPKRRLVRIAWRVYQSTLLFDGDRLTVTAKARRYVELVCFLFDSTMLRDVLALRMSCNSNNERRRFPVNYGASHELEANIIEEWLGYGSCRFVSADIIHTVMEIHRPHSYLAALLKYK
jgi:hypothetical protein